MKRRDGLETDADLCDFCFPSEKRNVLYEDENVYVMPCLGQYVEGYLLMINNEHEGCFGDVMDGKRADTIETIRRVLESEYGSYCFFEHGRTGSCFHRGLHKICYHAHIHCLPIPTDFHEAIEEDWEGIEIDDVMEIRELREQHKHYLFLETHNGRKKFYIAESDIERQYLRKMGCEALGLPIEHSNWRDYPFWDRMQTTAETLRDEFRSEVTHP